MQHEPVETKEVIGGFDCHSEVHVGAALDPLGRLLGTASFAATPKGYRRALECLRSFGPVIAVGAESTGSFGAALARVLTEWGLCTIEINQPHRHTRRRRGKTDAIDAEAAARKVLSGEARGAAKDTRGIAEAIRQLAVAREGAVKARTAALCPLGDLLVTAPAAVREQLAVRKSLEGKVTLCARLRPARGDLRWRQHSSGRGRSLRARPSRSDHGSTAFWTEHWDWCRALRERSSAGLRLLSWSSSVLRIRHPAS